MSDKSYEQASPFWARDTKTIQSDFVSRPYMIPLLGETQDKKVADLGCGEGYVSRMLAANGATVIGVDNSADMIHAAQANEDAHLLGIEYHIGDVCALPPEFTDASFDAAISVAVTPHLSHQEVKSMISEAYRILKPNGTFVLSLPHPQQFLDKPLTNWISYNYDSYIYEQDRTIPVTLYTGDDKAFEIPAVYPHNETVLENMLLDQGFSIQDKITPLATQTDLQTFPEKWGVEDTSPAHVLYQCRK